MKKTKYLIITCLLLCNIDSFAGSGCPWTVTYKGMLYKKYIDTIYVDLRDSVKFNIYCYGVQEGPFYLNWYKNDTLINPIQIYSKDVNLFATEEGHYRIESTSHITLNYYLINNNPVATKELDNNSNLFDFFPNPSHDKITISLKEQNDNIKISLIDQQGKEMQLNYLSKSNQEVAIDIKEFPRGIYFLKYEDKIKVVVKKLAIY